MPRQVSLWCVTSRLLVQTRYNLSLIKVMKGIDIDEYKPQAGNRNYDDRIQNIQPCRATASERDRERAARI